MIRELLKFRGWRNPPVSSFAKGGVRRIFVLFAFIFTFLPLYHFTASVYALNPDNLSLKVRIDMIDPAGISDLVVQKATGTEGALFLTWTEPGDDGMSGQASEYLVRFSSGGNINDLTDFSTAAVYNSGWSPGSGGSLRLETLTALIPGQTYYFAIRAQDAVGRIGFWSRSGVNQTNFAPAWDEPPAQVTGVTALSGDVQVSLSWSDLSLTQKTTDFEFYRVYRATNSNFIPQNISTQTTLTTYIDTNVINGTTYYYRVVGADKGLNSVPAFVGDALESLSWSTVTARPMPPLPFAPSNLQTISVTTAALTWQWLDNANNEDGFRLYASTGGLLVAISSSPGTGATTSFIQAGLTPGASYGILIRAFNLSGESTGSVSLTTYTLANPPINLTRSTATTASITLSWEANSNSPATRYILSRATWPLVSFTQIADTTSTVFISSGLAEETTYTFRLKARNGENIDSAAIEFSTNTVDVLPPAPTNLTTLSVTESTVTITWTPPSPNPGDLDFYKIYISSQTPAVWVATATVSLGITTYAVTGLTAETTYQFKLTVVDKGAPNFSGIAFESADSNIISAKLKVTAPSAFTFVQMQVTTESITWQWQDNSLVETGFRIYSTTGGVMGSTGAVLGAGTTQQWTETGLTPGASYQRYVVAVQGTELSDPSNTVNKYTLPNPPANLVSSTATTASITLSWEANSNSPATRYILSRATWPQVSFTQIADITNTTFISTGLAEFTTYTYRLKASNGEGVPSAEIEFSTMTTKLPPAKITSLQASMGPFEGSVFLRWLAPGDDGTTGDITSGLYDIRWSTENISVSTSIYDTTPYQKLVSTNAVAGSQQGFLLTGLNFPNQTVYFAMKTRDKVPNNFSAMSNVVNSLVQTDITAPEKVNNLQGTLLSSTSVRLTWTAPGDDGESNNNTFGAYQIKYATFPLNDLDTFLLPSVRSASDFGTIPSPPANAGTQETMVLSGLALDTTYYFALRTRDEVPNWSALSNGATSFTPDLVAPGSVQNLKAVADAVVGKRIDLSWENPSAKDLKGIRILVRTDVFATLPGDTTAQKFDLTFSSPLTQPPTTFAHKGLTVGVTYFYSVFAFDDENPANFSAPAFASSSPVKTQLPPPAKPKGVKGKRSGDGQSFAISWEPVTTRADGTAMEPLELSSYTIYRLESVQGATNQIFAVGAGTLTFRDTTLGGQVLFYKVRAVNVGGTESEDSDIVSSDVDETVMVMMDDGISFLAVPGDLKVFLDNQNLILRGTRDLSQEGGVTFKSMNVEVRDGVSGVAKKNYLFDKPIGVAIGYQVDAGGKVTSAAPGVHFAQPLPKAEEAPNAFSIYWFTGAQWVKLGTTVDTNNKTATVKSKHSGAYQLRLVQQALSSQMNAAYPRTITPNGDGINDVVFFLFENPTDAPVKGTIYDMKSAKVADAKLLNLFGERSAVLSWDGKDDSGAVVTAGIYLYRIEIGDKAFTGTVVVAR